MGIRVTRILQYEYEDVDHMIADMKKWTYKVDTGCMSMVSVMVPTFSTLVWDRKFDPEDERVLPELLKAEEEPDG